MKLYRQTKDIDFVLRRYHISKASLMRWNKLYDRTTGSFMRQTSYPPRHNGKVECSHRNDQERFYNHLKFYSYEDLQIQMKRFLQRSNRIPMAVFGWKTPIQKRYELEAARLNLELCPIFLVSHH